MQNQYLRGLVVPKDVHRVGRQGKGGVAYKKKAETVRYSSYEYYVPVDNNRRVRVCQQAFISIHGITERRVRTIRQSQIPNDRRGKHPKKKVPQIHIDQVKSHIRSFPRMTSHYSRKKAPRRRYLNPGLSVNRMYNMYLQKYEPLVWKRRQEGLRMVQEYIGMKERIIKPTVSSDMYRRIFRTDFNLSFGLPRSDTCSTCDGLKIAIDSESNPRKKERLRYQLDDHHRDAERGYKSVSSDAKDAKQTWVGQRRTRGEDVPHATKDAVDIITFDFQQNLPTPNLTHSDMFYARQLWTYNFGIHDCVSEQGFMYMWAETTARRGSSEVASCLMHYIQQFATGAKSLVSYSDNCAGQNKNLALIGLYTHLHEEGVYNMIDHKFLYKGHSFLPNDRDYGQTEKRKTTADVQLPEDWFEVFREANPRKPFTVVEVKQEDIKDWKGNAEERYCHRKVAANGTPVNFSKIHWINFGWGAEACEDSGEMKMRYHPNEVWLRNSLSTEEPWMKVRYRKKNAPAPSVPPRLYEEEPLPLKKAKVVDLRNMASKFLPARARSFYLSLKSQREKDGNETDHLDSD